MTVEKKDNTYTIHNMLLKQRMLKHVRN